MTGLAYAINRAYHAWIKTQPQLILDLWPDDGLDETQTDSTPHVGADSHRLCLVEPAASPSAHPAGSTQCEGADASPSKEPRRRQGGAV